MNQVAGNEDNIAVTGLLQRDIKPDNIMSHVDARTGKNVPVLLDTGAARADICTRARLAQC